MNLTMPRLKKGILIPLFRYSFRYVDQIICVSNHVKGLYDVQKVPVDVIYNPIIIDNVPPASYKVPGNNLIFVGNQFVAKGFSKVLEKIDYLDKYSLHFFGIRDEQISFLGDRNNVKVYSFSDRKKLFMKINDLKGIVVITSLTEGFGMFVAECAKLQYPMILNNLKVYKEFLDISKKNLFDISNFESLIRTLERADFEAGVKIKSDFEGSISRYLDNTFKIYKKING